MSEYLSSLCAFLNQSHSVYHAQRAVVRALEEAGYTRLEEQREWEMVPGGKYYVSRGGTSVIGFRLPQEKPAGFLMSASHCDRPSFKIKENPEIPGKYIRLAVDRYGSMIMGTWLDRPLSVAGRVTVAAPDGVRSVLVDIDRDLLVIPNVAIHMNRQINDGMKWNAAVDLPPLAGSAAAAGKFRQILEQEAGGEILGADLYLYIRQKASVWGLEEEFLSSAALDDLECVWGCTQGFLNAGESGSVNVLCVFDSEEVGSVSAQGAVGTLLSDVLYRICETMGWNERAMLAQSFMLSADNGHALHPNHPEYADPSNAPILGGGVVLKYNANQRYCTDGVSAALVRTFAAKAGVKLQSYYNRSDLSGGSTLGRLSLEQVSVPTADVGMAQLAMHSCFETASARDAEDMAALARALYSSTLELEGESYRVL